MGYSSAVLFKPVWVSVNKEANKDSPPLAQFKFQLARLYCEQLGEVQTSLIALWSKDRYVTDVLHHH